MFVTGLACLGPEIAQVGVHSEGSEWHAKQVVEVDSGYWTVPVVAAVDVAFTL